MFDDYQIPAIALIAALMLAFVYLHLRFRSLRTLLWILALGCAEIQALLLSVAPRFVALAGPRSPILGLPPFGLSATTWIGMGSEAALMLSSAFFLASLSPLSFRIGQLRILYAVPYAIPLLLYTILYYGVSQHPSAPLSWLYCLLAVWAAGVAFVWSLQKGAIPVWMATAVVVFFGLISIPFFVRGEVYWPFLIVESGNMVMTALLVIYTYRRISPGVFLATAGFLAWAVPPFFLIPSATPVGMTESTAAHLVILAKVILAMGLILLVLEDEVEKNQTARQRERRIRLELEAYARQALTARSLEEFDRDSGLLCAMIVEHSRFSGAALIVRSTTGAYTLVGYAGMDGATAGALDAVAQRLPLSCFAEAAQTLVPETTSLDLDLTPWLTPGDDLERLHLTRVGAVPMFGPGNSADGALLLIGPRVPLNVLRADDLLPLEVLAGRLQAARAQALMLGKLIDSERFAGVGQLANNVAQQLNNPLTVILGYSALLEESAPVGPDRRGVEAIAVEARRMKSILDRLSRFSRLTTERFNSFSVADLITDIEQLLRTDFLRHSIEFRSTVQPELPNIFGNAHQIRQALMHATQFAIEAVQRVEPNQEKSVRIEAAVEDERIQILIAHSGPSFPHPDRVFDSFTTGFSGSEATGIGLSLCAAIVREHRGNILAVNYEPTGAAILFDLPLS
jgi:signal transduction histidine kinase